MEMIQVFLMVNESVATLCYSERLNIKNNKKKYRNLVDIDWLQ